MRAATVRVTPRPLAQRKVYSSMPFTHRTPAHLFWSKVEFTNSCWLWQAAVNDEGYGRFGPSEYAHRWAYEFCVGPLPDGLQIDHLCRVRNCVNPDHLEPVTGRTNILRGISFSAVHARKTHCPQGHPYDEANTYTSPTAKRRSRQCLACMKKRDASAEHLASARAYYHRHK